MDNKEQLRVDRGADVRTFLIADVRGYTRFTQEQGDEAAGALAARFAEIAGAAVTDLGGQLLELRGDEALAVFSSARGALRAAVELQLRLRTPTESGPPLALGVGIGLDSGEAVPIEGGYRGGALNLAARLCAIAERGQILASETVVSLARRVDGLRFVTRRAVRLKGLADPVRMVEITPERPLPTLPQAPSKKTRPARGRASEHWPPALWSRSPSAPLPSTCSRDPKDWVAYRRIPWGSSTPLAERSPHSCRWKGGGPGVSQWAQAACG